MRIYNPPATTNLKTYKATFNQSDLDQLGVLNVNHLLNKSIVTVIILNDLNEQIQPEKITQIDSNNIAIDMSNYSVTNYRIKLF